MSYGIPVKQVSEQCDCKKGYRSRIDGKCENCRSKKDKHALNLFWKEYTEKDIRQTGWEFSQLRRKHFGVVYEIN